VCIKAMYRKSRMHNNYAGLLASMIIHHIQLDINCHQKQWQKYMYSWHYSKYVRKVWIFI